ncbi:hypothetical protein DIPPA_30998 [Diplonema papillatum]|nr:hypothetical protein DIPPA_30998 [Diplonema papillatum]
MERIAQQLQSRGVFVKAATLESISEETGASTADELYEELKWRNIHDWGDAFLPKDIGSQPTSNLKGIHVLQVDKVRDITQAKIQDDTDDGQPDQWGATKESRYGKASRLLKLMLTDGVSTCVAVELVTNPAVKSFPLPGTKVLLRDCPVRNGYCIIKQDTFEVIGGGVEELESEYNLELQLAGRFAAGSARSNKFDPNGPPPFVPFGKTGGAADLIPERAELTKDQSQEPEEEKQKRSVDVEAADYRRHMGPQKQQQPPQRAPDGGDDGGKKGGGKKGGKSSFDTQRRVCQDYDLGKCNRGRDCKFFHDETTKKRWPGGGEAGKKADAPAADAGKKSVSILDEPILMSKAEPPPVLKKEARVVEPPSLPEGMTLLQKEEEKDMFGNAIKDKKPKEPKEKKKESTGTKFWACKSCSYENIDAADCCVVCDYPRDGKYKPQPAPVPVPSVEPVRYRDEYNDRPAGKGHHGKGNDDRHGKGGKQGGQKGGKGGKGHSDKSGKGGKGHDNHHDRHAADKGGKGHDAGHKGKGHDSHGPGKGGKGHEGHTGGKGHDSHGHKGKGQGTHHHDGGKGKGSKGGDHKGSYRDDHGKGGSGVIQKGGGSGKGGKDSDHGKKGGTSGGRGSSSSGRGGSGRGGNSRVDYE